MNLHLTAIVLIFPIVNLKKLNRNVFIGVPWVLPIAKNFWVRGRIGLGQPIGEPGTKSLRLEKFL